MSTLPNEARPGAAATLSVGASCRRCRYDLRGQPRDGRCPECGLAVAISAPPGGSRDVWEAISEGCRWMGHSLVLAAPAYCLTPLSPDLGMAAAAALATHAWCHWFGMRDLALGLAPVAAESGVLTERLRHARGASHLFAGLAAPVAAFALLPCLVGSAARLPGGTVLVLLALLTPTMLAAQVTARRLLLDVADACAIRDELPIHRFGTPMLIVKGSLTAVAWMTVALSLGFPAPAADRIYPVAMGVAIVSGLLYLIALWDQWKLFASVGTLAPKVPRFSEAARRVELQRRGPLRTPRDARQAEDLSPLAIVEDEPGADDTGPRR